MKERIGNTRFAAAEDGCIRATFLKALAQFVSLSALLRHHYRGLILLIDTTIMKIKLCSKIHLLCSALCLMLSSTYYAQKYAGIIYLRLPADAHTCPRW